MQILLLGQTLCVAARIFETDDLAGEMLRATPCILLCVLFSAVEAEDV
jgi:hypothetical protein